MEEHKEEDMKGYMEGNMGIRDGGGGMEEDKERNRERDVKEGTGGGHRGGYGRGYDRV